MSALLELRDLAVALRAREPERPATPIVDGVDLVVERGETLGLVGESGCGKSTLLLALLDLLPTALRRVRGEVLFDGRNLALLEPRVRRRIAGSEIGVVFQEPTRSLNPVLRVGEQVAEVLRCHRGLSRTAARARAVELLDEVGIERPELRARDYPHQLSGGMNQRVAIAAAIACEPELLLLDEPTTALDVTVQREILDLFDRLRDEHGMAMLFVTHDLAVVRRRVDRVAVMYAGRVVEEAAAAELFRAPRHPYTHGLLACQPAGARPREPLPEIGGAVPRLGERPAGCAFHPRCPRADERCGVERPELAAEAAGRLACFHPFEPASSAAGDAP